MFTLGGVYMGFRHDTKHLGGQQQAIIRQREREEQIRREEEAKIRKEKELKEQDDKNKGDE